MSDTFSELVQFVDDELLIAMWGRTWEGYGPHGSREIRDEATVFWICESIRRAGREMMPPFHVAGIGLCRIVKGHAFIDCNHRTGWLVCQTLMEVGGYELVRPTNEVVDFVKSIDSTDRPEEEVVEWVRHSFLRLG